MRFGVCTGPENLEVISQAGFDYLEPGLSLLLQPEQPESEMMPALGRMFADAPLRAECFNLLLPGGLKIVGPETDPARQARYLDAGFRRAGALGGRVAVFGSGGARQIPPNWMREKAHAQVVAFLQLCGGAAARYGMTVAIEPLNRTECNHINSVAEADALAEEVGDPAVGVLSDLYHIMQEGQSYRETFDAMPRLLHVHIAGKEGRRAPVAADREFLREYFTTLKTGGYEGRISVEGGWDDLPTQAAEALETLRRAWDGA